MPTETLTSRKNQVKHVVAFKYNDRADIPQITDAFKSLKNKIPGILSFEYGPNNSPEGFNKELTHIYLLTFEDVGARDRYLDHPEHKKFNDLLSTMRAVEDTLVVDFPVNE